MIVMNVPAPPSLRLRSGQALTFLLRGALPKKSLLSLALDDRLFRRKDRLCQALREHTTVDFRGWQQEKVCRQKLSRLFAAPSWWTFTKPTPGAAMWENARPAGNHWGLPLHRVIFTQHQASLAPLFIAG